MVTAAKGVFFYPPREHHHCVVVVVVIHTNALEFSRSESRGVYRCESFVPRPPGMTGTLTV
jgi:hypothetical protein